MQRRAWTSLHEMVKQKHIKLLHIPQCREAGGNDYHKLQVVFKLASVTVLSFGMHAAALLAAVIPDHACLLSSSELLAVLGIFNCLACCTRVFLTA